MSTFKRFLSLVVALVMVIGMVPGTVFAATSDEPVARDDSAVVIADEEVVTSEDAPITVVCVNGHTQDFDSLAQAMRYGESCGVKEIVVHEDITEEMDFLEGNIVTNNANGVTIKNTIVDEWIYCDGTNFTIGEGITYDATGYASGLFVYGDNCVINGTVLTDCYYQRYAGTKLTINEPGSMTVKTETFILRYTDGDPNAGIYIVGDNNDETVGLNASVIYFYQGVINAKDADIQVGTYWQTNETDGQGSANLVLDNTNMNVTVNEHNFKATGTSTVTMTNGSNLACAGGIESSNEIVADASCAISDKTGSVKVPSPVAIGNTGYESLEAALAAAVEGDTITLLSDATPALTSQRAITKAAEIDLGGNTLTLTEDDLYFGTTTFKNGNIVVDPSVKASTAVFWMFEGQTLTFEGVKIVATGVTGTYLIGINGGTGTAVNLIDSSIVIANAEKAGLTAVICDNGDSNSVVINGSDIDVTNVDGRFYLGGTNGTITVEDSDLDLNGVKEGFFLRAGQTLAVEGTSSVDITLNDTNGRYGINLNEAATYTKAETATVNATDNAPEPVAKIGDQGYKTLQAAIDAAVDGDVITLLAACAENVTVTQAPDVEITIDGNGNTMSGSITVDGKSATYTTAGVTIQNVKFDATAITTDACINLGVSGDTSTRYTCNVTVKDCSFTGGNREKVAIKSYTGGDKNLTVTGCTVDNTMHSLLQADNIAGVVIDGCTVNSKNGINLNSSSDVEIKNSTVAVSGYAVRVGVSGGTSGKVTLTGNTLKTDDSEGDAVVVVRGTAATLVDLDMTENVVSGATHISGTTAETKISAEANYWDGQSAPVVSGTAVEVDTYYADAELQNLKRNSLEGEGTETNPYLIKTAEDLAWLRDQLNTKSAVNGIEKYAQGQYFTVAADINLSGVTWKPIYAFYGVLYGANHTISNFKVDTANGNGGLTQFMYGTIKDLTISDVTAEITNQSGMFAPVASTFKGNLDNVHTKNITVTVSASGKTADGPSMAAGMIVWDGNQSSGHTGTLKDCSVENFVVTVADGLPNVAVAGFVGIICRGGTESYYDNCSVNGMTVNMSNVVSECSVGGFVNQTETGWNTVKLDNCHVSGINFNLSGSVDAGGFICHPGAHTTITNSSAAGTINASGVTSGAIGGFVADTGWNDNLGDKGGHAMSDCSADVDITSGGASAGGFIGTTISDAATGMPIVFTNCSASGDVTNTNGVAGGFTGYMDRGTYNSCEANGNVSATEDDGVEGDFFGYITDESLIVASVTDSEGNVVKYLSLQAAIDAAEAGETVTLLRDIALTEGVVIAADDEIVLDLNGKTVSYTSVKGEVDQLIENKGKLTIDSTVDGGKITFKATNSAGTAIPGYASNTITNKGELVVKGGTIENTTTGTAAYVVDNNSTTANVSLTVEGGALVHTQPTYSGAIRLMANSETYTNTVNINGGEVSGRRAIWIHLPGSNQDVKLAELNVTGGTVTSTDASRDLAVYVFTYGDSFSGTKMNFSGGTIDGNIEFKDSIATGENSYAIPEGDTLAAFTITGGTYYGSITNATKSNETGLNIGKPVSGGSFADGTVENYLAEGYDLDYANGMFNVVAMPIASVAGVDYTNLQAAIDAAIAGEDTVYLKSNVASGAVTVNGKVTIDLRGYTVTGSILAPNAELTVRNGSIVNKDSSVSALEINAGKLTLEDVNMDSARHALRIDGAVEATIDGGTYRSAIGTGTGTYHAVNVSGGAKVTIKDGTFVGPKGTTADSGSAVNVQDGTTVIIEGGSFSGGKNSTLNKKETGTLTVKGGTFDQDPTAFAAAGYVVENADGVYGVAKDPYAITDLADLKAFRDAVNAGNNYAGKTVKLYADIDLAGEEWTPISTFNGTFDGQGYTISNLVINGGSKSNQGFFGQTNNGEIKNLTIENAKVTGRLNVGVVAGTPYTSKYTNIKVTGHVEVNGMAYVGGVGGKNAYANWTDITVDVDSTSYVKADSVENGNSYRTYVGGVVGFNGEGSHTFKNISSNIKVIGNISDIGGLFGIAHYGNNFENVTFTGSVEAPEGAEEVGGIAGVWHNQKGYVVSFTNATSTGTVTVGETTTTGSIVGAAYNADNRTSSTSGSLLIDGKEAWLAVAKIGDSYYATLAEALAAAEDGDTITLLWAEGDAPIAMNGAVYGKSVTITGTATVDWNKGFLFIGRGGEGNGTVIFDGANLTSASNSASYGIHVSGREKNTNNKYDGTLVIKDSTIELDYLINKGAMTLDNSTLTVKNGFSIGGRPASETESGVDATATLDLTNGSKVVVNNHNGMGLGYEAIGVMNIDATSTFETTKSFLVTAKGTMNIAGTAKVAGTLTNNGSIVLTDVAATLTSSECGNVTTNVDDYVVTYADGAYKLTDKPVASVTDAEGNVTDYTTIKAAIDAANAGDIVTILAGNYTTNLTVNKAITVVGETDAQGNNLVNITGNVSVHSGATVKNLNVHNEKTGTYDCALDVNGSDIVIDGVKLTGYNGMRYCYAKGDVTIKNSTINASYFAVHFDGSTGGNLRIENCDITGWVSYGGGISNVTLEDSTFDKGSYSGMRSYAKELKVNNCTFSDGYKLDLGTSDTKVDVKDTDNALALFNGEDIVANDVYIDDVKVTYVAKIGSTYYSSLEDALANVADWTTIKLVADATLDYNAREAYGRDTTTDIIIDGQGFTLTLNQKDSDWSSIGMANPEGKLTLKNMIIEKTGYGDTSGAWNTHAIQFTCNVEMKDVTVNNSMAVKNGATLNNVTINEANGYYGLWISGNGQTVTVNGGSINATNGGRGIKIADEYVDAPASVTLTIDGTDFNTAKKAAVLVTSTAGANITGTNYNIEDVAADNVNLVWNDEDRAAYYDKITVTGGTVAQEGDFPIEVKDKDGNILAYYKTLDDLFAATIDRTDKVIVTLYDNVVAKNAVDTSDSQADYYFYSGVNEGVTMTFEYADNWNSVRYMTIGKGVTLNANNYLSIYGGVFDIYGTVNTGYAFATASAVTVKEGGALNVTTGQKTLQVKNNSWLEVYGTVDAGTVNVWNDNSRGSHLIVSGANAKLNAEHIHAWNNKSYTVTNEVVVEKGATLTATNFQADRGSKVTVDAATLTADSLTLGYEGNVGTLTVKNDGVITNGVVLNSVTSTVTGPDSMNVTTSVADHKVVYEEGVYKVVAKTYVAQIGETKYESLAEAYSAAQADDTIELLADVTLAGKLTITKAITIDGNGHSIIADETAVWYTVSGKLNIKSYKTHLIGVNSDNVTLQDVVLDCNNNAAGINIYCAQNVVFENVSIINATKGMAALTVNGSTLTVKNTFSALGNAIALDISNGSGVTSALGVTIEDGTVLDLGNKTVKFASVAVNDVTGAVDAEGNPYFAAMDNAYYYTKAQMESRTTGYTNGLILLDDVELSKDLSVKGTLNLNGYDLTVAEGKVIKVSSSLIVTGEGTVDGEFSLTSASVTLTGPEGLTVTTTVADHVVVYANGVYSVAKAVAKIGDTCYATLEAALEAAQTGETIVLLIPITVAAGETLEIDLAGKTISYVSNVPGEDMITNRGTLTISDSVGGGKITYNNTDTTASNATVSTISTEPGSVLNVLGGTIENKTVKADGSAIYPYAIDILTNGNLGDVTVNISGGTVYSDYMAIRQFNNGEACKNTLNVTGGTIYGAKRAIQVHLKNNAAYTNISGGVIEGGDYSLCFLTTSENLSVTGGMFKGAVWYSGENGFISGGVFDEEPDTAYIVEGFECLSAGNGMYAVVGHEHPVTITTETVEATCKTEGSIVITVTCNTCGKDIVTKTEKLPLAQHTIVSGTCTVCGEVFEAVELPEVVVTDITDTVTDPELTFALNFAIKDVENLTEEYLEALFNTYGHYYTDYVLTIEGLSEESVTFNANGDADGYLAGQYDAWSTNWVSVPFEDVTVKNGESLYIMEYAAKLMGQSGLRFTLAEVAEIVQNFDCGVYFTPEFLAANPDMVVTLELKVFTEDEAGNKIDDISVATNVFKAPAIAAAIGDTYYATLQEAILAAVEGATIELLRDGEIAAVVDAVTINRNGFTATVVAGKGLEVETTDAAYTVTVKETTGDDTIVEVPGEGDAVAYIDLDKSGTLNGDEVAQSLHGALRDATSGQIVRLTGDLDLNKNEDINGTVVIPAGVTLDLQTNSLTADYIVGVNGSFLTATNDTGNLIVAKENLVLSEKAYQDATTKYYTVPLWDPNACGGAGAYQFSLMVVRTTSGAQGLYIDETNDMFYFRWKHVSSAYAKNNLLNDGSSDNAVKMVVRVEWETGNGKAYQDFVYNDTQVGLVSGANDYTMTINGFSALEIEDMSKLKVYGVVITDSGATCYGDVWTADMDKNN